jgi:restriction endonuclease S subunit
MARTDWRKREICEFATKVRTINESGEDLPPLSVTKHHGVILQSDKYKKRIATDSRKYQIARRGDFIFDPMSLYYGAIGRQMSVERGLASPDYVVFTVDDSVDPVFLTYLLRARSQVATYEANAETGNVFGKRRRLYWSTFEKLTLRMPDLVEQRRIADALQAVDRAIATTEAVCEQIAVVKKATARRLLTKGLPGKVVALRSTDIGDLPKHWDVTQLGDCGRWLSGGTPSKANADLWKGELPWVSPKDMKVARLHDAIDHVATGAVGHGTQLAPQQSILMVVRGMILAHSFPVALVERAMAFNQDLKCLVPSEQFEPEFLLYWLQTRVNEVLGHTEASNHGTRRLPTEKLWSMIVPVPPRAEQVAVVEKLRSLDRWSEREEQCLACLRDLQQAVSAQLLSGEVRLNEPKEVAA